MPKIHLYFRLQPQQDRYLSGDRHLIVMLKKLIPEKRASGVKKVFLNLCRGLDELNVRYDVNLPFKKIKPGEPVVVLGNGEYALEGYDRPNLVIAGIGLMTHPAEWPDLFKEYPVALYLQHSAWTKDIYARVYGDDKCAIWPAGIDTAKWSPKQGIDKTFDLLLYNKIMWDKEKTGNELRSPIIQKIKDAGLSYKEIAYGQYREDEYYHSLQQSKAMIFLCEHESQGFALEEALAMGIPVIAWDQGFWLDPARFKWGEKEPVPASSVPYFDERCGMIFKDLADLEKLFDTFWNKVKEGAYSPREYILENLTLKKSAQDMLDIIGRVYK